MADINLKITTDIIIKFISDSVRKNGFSNGILGVSGGIDSAVVLSLTERALGKDHTFALLMPYKTSSPDSLTDGELICDQTGVSYEIVDISPAVDSYFTAYPTDNRTLIGNKCARERMSVLYDFSARKQALVVGTSNKTELLIGYSTLFGDSAAAFFPIGDLYKTEVIEVAKYLGIPESIISKKPSADLWENQTDEGEIGVTYKVLDDVLYRLIDLRETEKEIAAGGIGMDLIGQIKKMVSGSQYKRSMPPVTKIHNRTIGLDFRYPRDWNR